MKAIEEMFGVVAVTNTRSRRSEEPLVVAGFELVFADTGGGEQQGARQQFLFYVIFEGVFGAHSSRDQISKEGVGNLGV